MGQGPVRLVAGVAVWAAMSIVSREVWAEDPAVEGAAESPVIEAPPPGFFRDAEGRVFQVAFDLNQRFWLGLGYRHLFFEDGTDGGGLALDLGFRVDSLSSDTRKKTRWRVLEMEFLPSVEGRLRLEGSLMRFDTSTVGDRPFLKLTTFVGGPARHDLYLQGGWWMEVLGLEYRQLHGATPGGETRLRFGAIGVHWDLWQDADMTSYVRLKVGGAIDSRFADEEVAKVSLTPLAAVEGDITFDDAGFHHLTFASAAELELGPMTDGALDPKWRFDNRLAYEVIALAIDDQPISLRLGGRATHREGVIDGGGWELAAEASLRMSFWVPPRDLIARDEARRVRSARTGGPRRGDGVGTEEGPR